MQGFTHWTDPITMPEGYSLGHSHPMSGETTIKHNKTDRYVAVCAVQYRISRYDKEYIGVLMNETSAKRALERFNHEYKKPNIVTAPNAQTLITNLCAMHRMGVKP